jgi:uncharacterized protein (TIGR02285 family)
MMKALHTLLVLLSASLLASASAEEMPKFGWLAVDLPPFAITSGPQAHTGYVDQIIALLQTKFTGYQHSITYGNSSRIEQEMKRGRNTCTVSMLRTPAREQYMVFSKPFLRIMPNGIITLRSQIDRLTGGRDSTAPLALADLIADKHLTLGLVQGRVYGAQLDHAIQSAMQQDSTHIQVLSGSNVGEGLYRLLQRKTIDYMIGYPEEEQYFFKRYTNPQATAYLAISENSALVDHSFGCSKTAWGRQRVEQMDHLLESKALRQQLQDLYLTHLGPEAGKLYRDWLERGQ